MMSKGVVTIREELYNTRMVYNPPYSLFGGLLGPFVFSALINGNLTLRSGDDALTTSPYLPSPSALLHVDFLPSSGDNANIILAYVTENNFAGTFLVAAQCCGPPQDHRTYLIAQSTIIRRAKVVISPLESEFCTIGIGNQSDLLASMVTVSCIQSLGVMTLVANVSRSELLGDISTFDIFFTPGGTSFSFFLKS